MFPFLGRSHPVRTAAAVAGQTQVPGSSVSRKGLSPSRQVPLYTHPSSKTALAGNSASSSTEINHNTHNEVEEGIDAVAFQSFNQPSEMKKLHRSSQGSSSINIQEIPLEDLSRKMRKTKSGESERRSFSFGGSHRTEHSRSHSHSPRRVRSGSGPASYSPERRTSRTRSVSSDKSKHDRSDSSSTITPCSQSGSQSSSDNSPETTRTPLKELAKLSQSPKTLRPAEEPILSLLVDGDHDTGSPTLLPPMETQALMKMKIGSPSGSTTVSSASASDDDNSEEAGSSQNVSIGVASSPAVQLTRLAQMVQEHYKYSEINNEQHAQSTFPLSQADDQPEVDEAVEVDDVSALATIVSTSTEVACVATTEDQPDQHS